MKVVIDTSVLVSAVVRDRDPEAIILWIAAQSDWDWVVSSEILEEYRSVLGREKFAIPLAIKQRWYAMLSEVTILVEPLVKIDFPRDQKDSIFLECALAAAADYIITGDTDFSEAKKFVTSTILSAGIFKRLVCDPAA